MKRVSRRFPHNFTPPTREQLRFFQEAAERFRQRAPWEFLYDRPLVAIEDLTGGEVAYAIITGYSGDPDDNPGVRLHLGNEGLRGWQ